MKMNSSGDSGKKQTDCSIDMFISLSHRASSSAAAAAAPLSTS